jgi:DNA-binding NtrC family response regulator
MNKLVLQPARIVVASESSHLRRRLVTALGRAGHDALESRAALEFLQQVGVAGPGSWNPVDAVIVDATGSSWCTLDLLETVREAGLVLPVLLLVRGGVNAAGLSARFAPVELVDLPVRDPDLFAAVERLVTRPDRTAAWSPSPRSPEISSPRRRSSDLAAQA